MMPYPREASRWADARTGVSGDEHRQGTCAAGSGGDTETATEGPLLLAYYPSDPICSVFLAGSV